METLSVPLVQSEPAASPASPAAEASATVGEAHDAGREEAPLPVPARASRAEVKEPPMTGREFFEYVGMFVVGVIIVVVTVWFYWLIQ